MTVNEQDVREGLPPGFSPPTSEGGRGKTLPAAGNGNGTSLNNSGSNGNYWSSTPNSSNSNNAWNLNFNSGNFNRNNNNRNYGFSVRALREFAPDPAGGASHRLLQDLIAAYRDARRHKRGKGYQTRFEMDQERELVALRDELLERRYKARPSSCFIIHDPKMREVFAADFRDRVVHHLFWNWTHRLFERTFIADSYSCIPGRGVHYGVERLEHHLRSCSRNWSEPCWVLKLDVKGYFMAIDRARLLARCRKVLGKARGAGTRGFPGVRHPAATAGGEPVVRLFGRGLFAAGRAGGASAPPGGAPPVDWGLVDWLLEQICMLDPLENCRVIGDRREWEKLPPEKSLFHARPGCGLPIGNLSSQLFSNVYLGALDDFAKRELKCRHWGRYVDDAFAAARSKEELWALVPPIRAFLREELGLELNEEKVRVMDAYKGVEFLGAFVKPWRTYPAARTLRRLRGRLMGLDRREGAARTEARVNGMLGALAHRDCFLVRRGLVWAAGLREAGEVSEDGLRFRRQGAGGGRGQGLGRGEGWGMQHPAARVREGERGWMPHPPSRAGRPRPQRRSEAEEVGVGVLQSFFKMKANISSTESKGPYVGSVPSKTRWRVAAVSAFGVSFASSSSVRVSPGGRASGAGMAGTPLFAGRGLLAEEVGVETGAGYDAYRASTESYRERLRSLSGSSISRCEAWEAFDGVEVVVVGKEDGTGFEGGGGNPDVVDGDGAALAAERRPDEAPADGDPLVGGQDTDAGTGQKGLEGGDVPLEFGPVGEAVIGFRDDGGGDDDLFGVFEKSAHGRMAGDEFGVGVGVDADDHGTGRGRWEGQGAKAEGGRPGHSSGSMRSQSSSMNRSNSAASSGVMMPANSERSRLGLGTAGEKAMERAATAAAFMLRPVSRACSARAVATSSGMLRMVMVFMGCLLFDGVGRLRMQPRTAIKCTEGDGKCKELFLENGAECPQIKRKTVVQTTRGA